MPSDDREFAFSSRVFPKASQIKALYKLWHYQFLAKSLDALKPGGVLALVTSHYTLDKQHPGLRTHLAQQADFLGAIRLPAEAFAQEGTRVVTDILCLRKRAPGEEARHADPAWLETAPLALEH
jgi:adenine-specific DNA methylase